MKRHGKENPKLTLRPRPSSRWRSRRDRARDCVARGRVRKRRKIFQFPNASFFCCVIEAGKIRGTNGPRSVGAPDGASARSAWNVRADIMGIVIGHGRRIVVRLPMGPLPERERGWPLEARLAM